MEGNIGGPEELMAFLILLNMEDTALTATVRYALDTGELIEKDVPLQPWRSTPINVGAEHLGGRTVNFRTVVKFRDGVGSAGMVMRAWAGCNPMTPACTFWKTDAAMLVPPDKVCP